MSRSRTPLYRELASLLAARDNCLKSDNSDSTEWLDKHTASMEYMAENYMPSGAGIDCGTKLDLVASKPNRLVFTFSFHHMNDNSMLYRWTEHTLIVTPSLTSGIDLRITGRDRNQVKDYLYETYHWALTQEVWQTGDCEWHSALYEPISAEFSNGAGI